MIAASGYIAWCTAKNRLRVRLRRLREPRYLLGAVVGIAYLYFAVFARGRRPGIRFGGGGGRARPPVEVFPPPVQAVVTTVGGVVVLVLATLVWLLPARSRLLEFSQAEREFLFPAPVSRRQLLMHRIVRSQVSALIASTFIALFAGPFSGAGRLRLAIGFWMLVVTIQIYFAAVALTRARLQLPDKSGRAVAWVPVVALLGGIAIVGTSVLRQFTEPAAGASDAIVRLSRATATGLPSIVLWPFEALVRAPFSASTSAFFPALGASFVVLAFVTTWMLLSDATFHAVAGEGGPVVAAVEERQRKASPLRATNVGWTLALRGRPELALFWKGAMETFRSTSSNVWRYVIPVAGAVVGLTSAAMGASGMRQPAAVVSIVAALVAGVATIFGPQIMRTDLRSDLEHLDVLKTWPMRAAEAIRGEMSWPVVFVGGIAGACVLIAALFSATALPSLSFLSRWSFAIAIAIAAPALIAAQFTVHTATAIVFPGWVQLGSQRTRGIDAMGQRLIMLAAILVSLLLFAIPGAIGGGVVWLILNRLLGNFVFVPAAVVFAAIVLIEVLAATELLGPAYDRIDATSVERGE